MLLKILDIKNDDYILKDKKGNELSLQMVFYDAPKLDVGDEIQIHKNLLDKNSENFVQPYFFGGLDSVYGREAEKLNDDEIIKICTKGKEIVLKRIYG